MSIWNLATDKDVEASGVWRTFVDDEGQEFPFLIASRGVGNHAFLKEFEREIRPFRRSKKALADLDQLSPDVQRTALIRVMARTILLGWTDAIRDPQDLSRPWPYTAANAETLLSRVNPVFDFVHDQSGTDANFRVQSLEHEAKNS